jgi:hypothetical protein
MEHKNARFVPKNSGRIGLYKTFSATLWFSLRPPAFREGSLQLGPESHGLATASAATRNLKSR